MEFLPWFYSSSTSLLTKQYSRSRPQKWLKTRGSLVCVSKTALCSCKYTYTFSIQRPKLTFMIHIDNCLTSLLPFFNFSHLKNYLASFCKRIFWWRRQQTVCEMNMKANKYMQMYNDVLNLMLYTCTCIHSSWCTVGHCCSTSWITIWSFIWMLNYILFDDCYCRCRYTCKYRTGPR